MKVTITIEDKGDTTGVSCDFDPPATNDTQHTGATILAMVAMEAIANRIAEEKGAQAVETEEE